MIRFRCPKCEREYLLADALAHLPLLCKGCGDRLVVPDPRDSLPEPPPVAPPPKPRPAFDRSLKPSPPPASEPVAAEAPPNQDLLVTPTADDSEVQLFLSAEVRKKLDVPIEGSGPAPALPVSASPVREAPPESASVATADRRVLAWFADGAVFILVLAAGAFVGEAVAGRTTLQILSNAPASPKFPPTDLLLWSASVAVAGLIYVWLSTRGWSLGARLSRR